jgi:hypothetical protein
VLRGKHRRRSFLSFCLLCPVGLRWLLTGQTTPVDGSWWRDRDAPKFKFSKRQHPSMVLILMTSCFRLASTRSWWQISPTKMEDSRQDSPHLPPVPQTEQRLYSLWWTFNALHDNQTIKSVLYLWFLRSIRHWTSPCGLEDYMRWQSGTIGKWVMADTPPAQLQRHVHCKTKQARDWRVMIVGVS